MTDEEFIIKLKKDYSKRKTKGVIGLIFVILFGAFSYLGFSDLNEIDTALLELDSFLEAGRKLDPIEIELIQSQINLAHSLGNQNGFLLGKSATFTGGGITFCLFYIFGGRKERLLIEYYEKTSNH